MNAPNTLSPEKIAADRKAYEPSMEEILASIRRIIADDQALPVTRPLRPHIVETAPPALDPPDAVAAVPPSGHEELRLDGWTDIPAPVAPQPPAMEAEVPPPPQGGFDFVPGRDFRPAMPPRAPSPGPSAFSREGEPPAVPAWDPLTERRQYPRPPVPGPRPAVTAIQEEALVSPETDAAVSSAFNTLVASRFLPSGPAMDELVRELLRPMLKAWLDDNLPILVERLVRAEIERVARGGR